ncbi:unnamed protein product [marine sediment metagenome]|uniref:Phage head-tail adaptor n=1 Tax=marine sediment metagenome TaxID=412755 RepID=X1D9T8_9ZZZZ
MSCKRITKKASKVCIGDLNKKILLYDRNIKASSTDTKFDEDLDNVISVWSMIKTNSGKDIFDGTEIIGSATHEFYIRYRTDLTNESWLEYNSNYYNILSFENLNEESDFLKLNCAIRGDKTKKVNLA